MLNVVLAEDNCVVRESIKTLLQMQEDINVVADAANGKELLALIKNCNKIDVLLSDLNMPEMGGLELIREIRIRNPEIKVLIFTIHDHEKYVLESFSEGASGYILKNNQIEELLLSLKCLEFGGKYLSTELLMKLINNRCLQIVE